MAGMRPFAVFAVTIVLVFGILGAKGHARSARPRSQPPHQWCNGCQAIVTETSKRIRKYPSTERSGAILEALEEVCQMKYLNVYDYTPPKMIEACMALRREYEDELEDLLSEMEEKSVNQLVEEFCGRGSVTEACVDLPDKPDKWDLKQHELGAHGIQFDTREEL